MTNLGCNIFLIFLPEITPKVVDTGYIYICFFGFYFRDDYILSKGADRRLTVGAKKQLAKGPSKVAHGSKGMAKGIFDSLRYH